MDKQKLADNLKEQQADDYSPVNVSGFGGIEPGDTIQGKTFLGCSSTGFDMIFEEDGEIYQANTVTLGRQLFI